MNHKTALLWISIAVLAVAPACQALSALGPATATPRPADTATPVPLPPTPTDTATPEPTEPPSATPDAGATATQAVMQAATQIAGSAPIFSDDFETVVPNRWFVGSTSNAWDTEKVQIKGGKYRRDMTAKKDVFQTRSPDVSLPDDFSLSVDAAQPAGTQVAEYGLVFRQKDNSNYYFFGISNTGQFSLFLLRDDAWQTLIDWQETSSIKPGKSNRLTVTAIGAHIMLYINDQLAGEVDDSSVSGPSMGLAIGLHKPGDKGSWEFDNLEVRGIGGGAEPTAAAGTKPPPVKATNIGGAAIASIPMMDGASGVIKADKVLTYSVNADLKTVKSFYETQMPAKGWTEEGKPLTTGDTNAILTFGTDTQKAVVVITTQAGVSSVIINITDK